MPHPAETNHSFRAKDLRNINGCHVEDKVLYRKDERTLSDAWNPIPHHEKFRRFYREYDWKYKTALPRAPAFRIVSARKIRQIVERVTTPSTISARPRTSRPELQFSRQLSCIEVKELNSRLSQQTMSSKLRSELKSGTRLPTNLDLSCDRCRRPPSVRFFPECYKSFSVS